MKEMASKLLIFSIFAYSIFQHICMNPLCEIISYRNIQMSRKMRHAVANLCLCLGLLFIVYTFGIRLYHFPIPCRIVGIVLHYLSLCTLFWMTAITL